MKYRFMFCLMLLGASYAKEVSPLLKRAEMAYQSGRWEESRRTFARAVALAEEGEAKERALRRLGEVNRELLFSKLPQEECVRVQVLPGDTLGRIAKRAGTTVDLIRKINGIRGDKIQLGQQLKVPILTFRVEVDISENTLDLFMEDRFFNRYRVSTGSAGNTPVGEFTIVNRIVHPTWWHPKTGERIPYGDPRHQIGTHWLGWDRKGFGIHGTDDPENIGRPVSLGCVRLRNEEVAELYMLLPIGTPVVVNE